MTYVRCNLACLDISSLALNPAEDSAVQSNACGTFLWKTCRGSYACEDASGMDSCSLRACRVHGDLRNLRTVARFESAWACAWKIL